MRDNIWKIPITFRNSCLSVKNMHMYMIWEPPKEVCQNWRLPWGAIAKTCSLVFWTICLFWWSKFFKRHLHKKNSQNGCLVLESCQRYLNDRFLSFRASQNELGMMSFRAHSNWHGTMKNIHNANFYMYDGSKKVIVKFPKL